MGGRSRVAAQMLAGKGFNEVYNLSGGIRGWKSDVAIGKEEAGLELFTGDESLEKTLFVAYSLEDGLRNFYLSMIPKVKNDAAKKLFEKLAKIEVLHQNRIIKEYNKISGKIFERETFEEKIKSDVIEGGLTTTEYANLFVPNWESVEDIISLAMSIEAQALDLYLRAAEKSNTYERKKVLIRIADEEQAHLVQLGKLMESV